MASKADGSIAIDITADPDKALSGINRINKSVNGLSSTFKKLGGAIIAAFAVDKIIEFGKEAVELGSDVAEVQNVVDVAFGDMAYIVEDFADTAIRSFGMSELAAKRTASTYMAMASNMGVTREQAAEMALTLTGLTGDVASFYNISQELADTKLKSVFTGETETLKDLGIVMTQANLEAYALANGINKTIREMSQSEQLILRYNYVLDQLSLASGDFIRTQDSWANQTRILSMQWEQFMSIIGEALIDVLLPVVQTLNDIVSRLIQIAERVRAIIGEVFGKQTEQANTAVDSTGELAGAIGEAAENEQQLAQASGEAADEQLRSLAAFDEINKIKTEDDSDTTAGEDSIISALQPAQGAGTTGDKTATYTIDVEVDSSTVEPELVSVGKKIKSWLGTIHPNIPVTIDIIAEQFEAFKLDMSDKLADVKDLFAGVWEDLKSLAPPFKEWFGTDFQTLLVNASSLLGTVGSKLAEILGTVASSAWNSAMFPALQTFVNTILPLLTSLANEVLPTLEVVIEEVGDAFLTVWNDAIDPALLWLSEKWDEIWTDIKAAWDKWGAPIFEGIREAVQTTGDVFHKIWNSTILPALKDVGAEIEQLWNEHIRPTFQYLLDKLGQIGVAALDIYNTVAPIIGDFIARFGDIFTAIARFVSDFDRLKVVIEIVTNTIQNLVQMIAGAFEMIAGILTGDFDRFIDGLGQILAGAINTLAGVLEGIVNIIVSILNGFIKIFNAILTTTGLATLLEGIGIGEGTIPEIPKLDIPRLAEGAVIPPNKPFLAALGDQKSGTNIETPLDTMVAAFRRALSEGGYSNNSGINEAVLEIDGERFGRLIYKLNGKESRRVGTRLVSR